jgi:hypothetical protein
MAAVGGAGAGAGGAKKIDSPATPITQVPPEMTRIWSSTQNVRVFNWVDLLEDWHRSLTPSSFISTLLANINVMEHPLSHFLTYLNNEGAGLKWFIHELVSSRWMRGSVRTDFLRELVNHHEVDLDSYFPVFVGSPHRTTVREFLESSLSQEELAEVNMMPPLVSLRSPPRAHARVPRSPPAPAPARPAPPVAQFRILRKDMSSNKDDLIIIRKAMDDDTYEITYKDLDSKTQNITTGLRRDDVIHHLRIVLRLLQVDNAPYESVQVIIPNLPTVLINVENLFSQTRDLIYDAMENYMDNTHQMVRL